MTAIERSYWGTAIALEETNKEEPLFWKENAPAYEYDKKYKIH